MDVWPVFDKPPTAVAALWQGQKGWRADSLVEDDWIIRLPDALVSDIHDAAVASVGDGLTLAQAVSSWRPPALVGELQDRVEEMLEGGIGFVLLRGLAPSGNDAVDTAAALMLSALFGQPVSQTMDGTWVARVEDLGKDIKVPGSRGYNTSAELKFHCDRADRIVLYCIRKSKSGGESRIVSSISVANALQHEYPELAERLFRDLPQDLRGEQAADQLPWAMLPVFANQDGVFAARYVRRFITESQRHPGAPPLDDATYEALEQLDEIAGRKELALDMSFEPGDLQVINNNVVLHSRTSYVDFAGPNRGRLLLRVWLAHCSSRPLPKSFECLYGLSAAGAYRGGVWPNGKLVNSRTPAIERM